MLRSTSSAAVLALPCCVGCGERVDAGRCGHCGAAQSAGRYRVSCVIARSPHGAVYCAEDERGARVALKELVFSLVPSIQELDAFEREAQLLRRLHHPALPALREAFVEGGGVSTRLYLAQEYVPGRSLADLLEERHFDEDEVLALAAQALEILEYLHGRSPPVVHRDVKPANLILSSSGQLKLVDFGAARAVAVAGTHAGTLVGTFGYMPPEQLGGTVEPRSDLYALGATLVHLLARRPPHELLVDGHTLRFEPHVNVTLRTATFLRRLVAPAPRDRFGSARLALDFLRGRTPGRPFSVRALQVTVVAALLVPLGFAAWCSSPQAPLQRLPTAPVEELAVPSPPPEPYAGPALQGSLRRPPRGERSSEADVARWSLYRTFGLWLVDGAGLGHHVLLPLSGYSPDFFGLRWDGSQDLTLPDDATFAPPGHFTVSVDLTDLDELSPDGEAVLISRGEPEGAFAWKLALAADYALTFTVRDDEGVTAAVTGRALLPPRARSSLLRRLAVTATFSPQHQELRLYANCVRLGVARTSLRPAARLPAGARVHLLRGVRGVAGSVELSRLLLKPSSAADPCAMSASGLDQE